MLSLRLLLVSATVHAYLHGPETHVNSLVAAASPNDTGLSKNASQSQQHSFGLRRACCCSACTDGESRHISCSSIGPTNVTCHATAAGCNCTGCQNCTRLQQKLSGAVPPEVVSDAGDPRDPWGWLFLVLTYFHFSPTVLIGLVLAPIIARLKELILAFISWVALAAWKWTKLPFSSVAALSVEGVLELPEKIHHIDADGTVLFESKGSRLYAVDADGKNRWFSKEVGADGKPLVGADGKPIPCFYQMGDQPRVTVCAKNSLVYVKSDNGCLCALNAIDGEEKWRFPNLPAVDGISLQDVWITRSFWITRSALKWPAACKKAGFEKFPIAAFVKAFIVFLLWHVSQPVLYFLALAVSWSQLSAVSRFLALLVALRELVYLVTVCVLVPKNPAFFLVDISIKWRENKSDVLTYVLAPDQAAQWANPFGSFYEMFYGGSELESINYRIEIVSILALVVLFCSSGPDFPWPLAVGYVVTIISFLQSIWVAIDKVMTRGVVMPLCLQGGMVPSIFSWTDLDFIMARILCWRLFKNLWLGERTFR